MKNDVYSKMLKELKKGNALYVEVENVKADKFLSRFRLVTSDYCEFDHYLNGNGIVGSCFLPIRFKFGPKTLINKMKKYDSKSNLKIINWRVL